MSALWVPGLTTTYVILPLLTNKHTSSIKYNHQQGRLLIVQSAFWFEVGEKPPTSNLISFFYNFIVAMLYCFMLDIVL